MEFIYKWALCNSRPLSDVQPIGQAFRKTLNKTVIRTE
ncbi:hypothetical protein PI172_0917 [Prevotella intermedia]|uniref:Uncharacterized protein n=1 Tax=Prevotella intermedia TaxID=28131 RepID=A0AAD1F6X4_PREIN|nr:hypothetical protein PI172_0917 [Prevotella intermedia]